MNQLNATIAAAHQADLRAAARQARLANECPRPRRSFSALEAGRIKAFFSVRPSTARRISAAG